MNPTLQDAFSGSAYMLQIPSGPAEISFTGQSPTAATAAPIGTSFIQGTGGQGSSFSTLLIVGLLILGLVLMRGIR